MVRNSIVRALALDGHFVFHRVRYRVFGETFKRVVQHMYTASLCAFFVFALCVLARWRGMYVPLGLTCIGFPAVGAGAGSLIFILLGVACTDESDFREVRTEREIVSLQSSVDTEGSFFLGTGSFEGVKKYYFFVNTKRGAISRSVRARETYIQEFAGDQKPRIVKVRFERIANGWYMVARHNHPAINSNLDSYNRIFIPKGSIKREYNPN